MSVHIELLDEITESSEVVRVREGLIIVWCGGCTIDVYNNYGDPVTCWSYSEKPSREDVLEAIAMRYGY